MERYLHVSLKLNGANIFSVMYGPLVDLVHLGHIAQEETTTNTGPPYLYLARHSARTYAYNNQPITI